MPPPRKSADILQLGTSAAHNRGRYQERIDGAVNDERPIGEAPSQHFITFEEAWAEVVDMCPDGVPRTSDRLFIEQAARLHMMLRNVAAMDALEFRSIPRIEVKYVKQFESQLVRLGASPADRGKVTVTKPKATNNDFD